jgi:ACS family hexuronate transporter-like MFS transporter
MTGRGHFRWGIVALLFLFALINTLDRQTLSVLAPTLQAQLGFSSLEYSYAISAFLAAYTLGYFFSGHLIDRWGVKVALALALGFWSLAAGAHALVHGWIGLAVCRFALGLGESFNLPGGMKSLAERTPPAERAFRTAIFSQGNAVGAILAPVLVSFLALHYGWRWGFFGTALLGIGLLVIWLGTYPSPANQSRQPPVERADPARSQPAAATGTWPETPAGSSGQIGWLLRQPLCLAFIFSRLLTDPISYFLSFWMPDYLGRGRGFSLALIGLVGWMPYLAGVIGGPGGGAVSDWLVRRGWSSPRARLRLMLVAAGLMPLAAGVTFAGADWLAIALLALLFAAQTCWMGNQLTLISESFPPHLTGKVIAWSSIGGGLGGILNTLFVGAIVEHHGYAPVFIGISGLPLLAYLVVSRQVNAQVRSASISSPT